MTKILSNKSNIDLDYPICRPSLDLDFTQEVLDPRITFSRGSIGTRVNRNRLIETVSANQPRFDFDPVTGECKGLMIEESRSNLITYSSYNSSTWGSYFPANATITAGITAPDGTSTAIRFTCTATGSSLLRVLFPAFTPNGTDTYTTSFYVRLISGTTSSNSQLTTDLADGNPGGNYLPSLIKNTWVRVSFSGIPTAVSKSFLDLLSDNSNNYVLDFWGAQLEKGAFPTSYIPTTASTVTRNADLVEMTGTNFSSWYNSTEGTLYAAARIGALGGNGYPGIVYVDDGTSNNCIGLVVMDAVTDRVATEAYVSGANQYFFNSNSAIIPNQLSKVTASYSLNNYSTSFSDRDNVQRDINGSIPTVNRMIIGDLRGGNGKLNGTISRLTYYPRALKPNQLQYLTQ